MTTSSLYQMEAIGISKSFGPLTALDNVTLRLKRGSFHALLGENGAGKSTLVKCIMGYYPPDAGELVIGDRQQRIASPHEAHQLGIGMVYQHFTLIPNMTVAENIVLARPALPRVVNWRIERRALEEALSTMPFRVSLDAPVHMLAAGEKQKVEIVKQLMLNPKVLILDEPTSVLTPNEADEVLGQIQRMTRERDLSVLMITHKFREVTAFADEVTVLRRGRWVGNRKVSETHPTDLAELMVGSAFHTEPLQRETRSEGPAALELRGLEACDDHGALAVRGASLTVRAGEILGIAGVSGNGQRQLIEVLAGQRACTGGEVRAHGVRYRATRGEMRQYGFHCLPEEPLHSACAPHLSVAKNLALRRFERPPFAKMGWLLQRRALRESATNLIARYGVRTRGPDQAIGELSGGNIQRSVLARELAEDVRILVVANPCFGLDFGAVEEIRRRLMAARNRGAAILLVSEDLDEILELSDRMLVMSNGALVYEATPATADRTQIGRHMGGH